MIKTIITTAFSLLVSLTGMSQIKIHSNRAEITLPKNVTEDTSTPTLITNDDGTVTLLRAGVYKYGNQNFSLNYSEIPKNPDFLNDIKRGIDNRNKRLPDNDNDNYHETSITKLNGISTLISSTKGNTTNYYVFYVVSQDYSYSVRGMLDFPPGEEAIAKENVNEILNGIKML